MRDIGVTRLADSTDLDELGIPVFSAIRPREAGGSGISVYNGKGLTKPESETGAMMEAIERYCGERWLGNEVLGSFSALQVVHPSVRVVDPCLLSMQQLSPYSGEYLKWGMCWELIAGESVLVPLNWLICPYYGPAENNWHSSTNGLASGNNVEEAICHALAELIERDAYTIAMVKSQLRPRMQSLIQNLTSEKEEMSRLLVDRSGYPLISLTNLPKDLGSLVRKVQRKGARIWLRSIVSDVGVPVFVASIQDTSSNGSEFVSGGFGCHPNSEVAAIRAVTEAAQGRIVQIQGAREDATQIGRYGGGERILWCNDYGPVVPFHDIVSFDNADILDDIKVMTDRLQAVGASSIMVADLSDPVIPVSVVKVVIPEMESWFLTNFSEDTCFLGERAKACLVV